jgi:hypothetical protein
MNHAFGKGTEEGVVKKQAKVEEYQDVFEQKKMSKLRLLDVRVAAGLAKAERDDHV